MVQLKKKIFRSLLLLGIIVGAFFEAQAQEVLTRVNGGTSWETPSDNNGIYSGNGTISADRVVNANSKDLTIENLDSLIVENSSSDNVFIIDGPNEFVGIGTGSPSSRLDVDGSVSFPVQTFLSGTLNLGSDHYLLIIDGTASKTLNLPSASDCGGRVYKLVNRGSTVFTLGSGSSYWSISGTTSATTIPANSALEIQSVGGVWIQINNF